MRRPSFRSTDLRKALTTARESGVQQVQAVIEPTGQIRLQFSFSSAPATMANEWDDVLK